VCKRERVCVCVCVRERERKRERAQAGVVVYLLTNLNTTSQSCHKCIRKTFERIILLGAKNDLTAPIFQRKRYFECGITKNMDICALIYLQ